MTTCTTTVPGIASWPLSGHSATGNEICLPSSAGSIAGVPRCTERGVAGFVRPVAVCGAAWLLLLKNVVISEPTTSEPVIVITMIIHSSTGDDVLGGSEIVG